MLTLLPFCAFLALIAQGTNAAPPTPRSFIILSPPPQPVLAPSPYPASPTTNEFKYLNFREKNDDDKKDRKKIHDGFQDFSPVIKAALEAADDKDDKATFDRWFPDKVLREGKDDLVAATT